MADASGRAIWKIGGMGRTAAWTAAALLLLAPLAAMQVTAEVIWGPADFLVFGGMLAAAGTALEIAVRASTARAYRWGAFVAVAALFLLVWMSLAVGIVGRAGDPANLMYAGVVATAIVSAALARLRPRGMAAALLATAGVQVAVGGAALGLGLGRPWSGPAELVLLNGGFAGLFLLSAFLFWHATNQRSEHR